MEFLGSPWSQITFQLERATVRVAVTPYLNGRAFELLPLRTSSDVLVTDACDRNVRCGVTNPSEIWKFLKRGVRCYSVAGLHAKVYRADNVLFVGSANASTHSANALVEAVVRVKNLELVRQFQTWLNGQILVPLTRKQIERLESIYRPPKWESEERVRRRPTTWITNVYHEDEGDAAIRFVQRVASRQNLEDDDVYSISYPKHPRFERLLSEAMPGDEFFVVDRIGPSPVVYPPLRLIERPVCKGGKIRIALEDSDDVGIALERFVRAGRRLYKNFSPSGRLHRRVSQEAASTLRALFK